jgi:hypothetical protein
MPTLMDFDWGSVLTVFFLLATTAALVALLVVAWKRARNRRKLVVSVAAAGLAIWLFWLWVGIGVDLVHKQTGVCLPPGFGVRKVGDGIDRIDCELPPG